MKANLECIPCSQRQAVDAARMITDDEELQERILREVMKAILKIDWNKTPPEISRVVHQVVKEIGKNQDPYKDVKKEYNDLALRLYPELKEKTEGSDDPIMTAIKLAIAGNVIDFGAHSNFDLERTIDEVLTKEFGINDYPALLNDLKGAKNITYLGDNTGEIVFDKLLLETIISRYEIEDINFVVKAMPSLNDSTMEDALYVGMDSIPKIRFTEVGPGFERNSEEFLRILKDSDIVISKGQGNYEALSEVEDIYFMLIAKCVVITRYIGVDIGDAILKKS